MTSFHVTTVGASSSSGVVDLATLSDGERRLLREHGAVAVSACERCGTADHVVALAPSREGVPQWADIPREARLACPTCRPLRRVWGRGHFVWPRDAGSAPPSVVRWQKPAFSGGRSWWPPPLREWAAVPAGAALERHDGPSLVAGLGARALLLSRGSPASEAEWLLEGEWTEASGAAKTSGGVR